MKIDLPGIGGSLGECVICGKNFCLEVITGKNVDLMGIKGIDARLPLHRKCKKDIPSDGDWKKLPEGPLRQEFEKAANKQKAEEAKA
jgi:hypothetical protein